LSFDLSRLSGLGLVRGLPKLKYQKDLVCAPCRHGKMVATSHPPLTSVMTKRPCELFHMDLVGPARVCSAGGKWYVLVIVDDSSGIDSSTIVATGVEGAVAAMAYGVGEEVGAPWSVAAGSNQ
jgi:hypothetical protein